jgi:hypothetical protein
MSLRCPGPDPGSDPDDDDAAGLAAAERKEMEEDAERLYQQGWAIRQVAARFDMSYTALRRVLARRRILRRPDGRAD